MIFWQQFREEKKIFLLKKWHLQILTKRNFHSRGVPLLYAPLIFFKTYKQSWWNAAKQQTTFIDMKKNIYLCIIIVLNSLVTEGLYAQIPTLLADINNVGNSTPQKYCKVNNIVFFIHDDEVLGEELWRTDGTAGGTYLVKDINPGYNSGLNDTREMVEFNGLLFFVANTDSQGKELWKSDGTAAGTVIVKDIVATDSSNPILLTPCGNFLMFVAGYDNAYSGRELWKTDGTTNGTEMVADISVSFASSNITEIVYAPLIGANKIFFIINNSSNSPLNGIWQTSYNNAGVFTTPTLISSTAGSRYMTFAATALFTYDLFFRNSSLNVIKFNINTSALTLISNFIITPTSMPVDYRIFYYSGLYFSGYDATNGWELWKSNGTLAGTALLKNINNSPASDGSFSNNFTVCNNEIYFSAYNGVSGQELWKTNGTTVGTVLVGDLEPGTDNSFPNAFNVIANKLYFQTNRNSIGENNYQIRVYDTSNSQFTLLKDFTQIPFVVYVSANSQLNQNLIFTGFDTTNGFEVWKSNGTVGGTAIIKDISLGNANASHFHTINNIGLTFFTEIKPNYDNNYYFQLWKTDGNSLTQKVSNLKLEYSDIVKGYYADLNNQLIFSATDAAPLSYNYELWKTDGTNTVLIKDINPSVDGSNPENFCNANGLIYFSADDGINGTELWKTDGTTSGTVLVKDINSGAGSSFINEIIYLNGFIYFAAYTTSNGNELWKSDGTTAGTTLVKDIDPGLFSSNPVNLTVFLNKIYFMADTDANGRELWMSDGTSAGTQLVKDINTTLTKDSDPAELTVNGSNTSMFFSADDGSHGRELFQTNGTGVGTVMVQNINPDMPSIQGSNPEDLTMVGNRLYFSAIKTDFNLVPANPYFGRELWKSDGSSFTTNIVKDININNSSIDEFNSYKFKVIGSTLFFPANDGINGTELWRSDGTVAGTFMVTDLFQGFAEGLTNQANLYANTFTNQVYFEATNGQNGRELWKIDYCPSTLNITSTLAASTQAQQASMFLNSSSNIKNTNVSYGKLNVNYRAGKAITLQNGFFVEANKLPENRKTVFKAEIGGCN